MYGGCNVQNNGLSKKDSALREILAYVKPDIFTVNEIGNEEYYSNRILDSCLNVRGVHHWQRGTLTQTSGGSSNSLANMIFYNARKLTLYSHFHIPNAVRDFNVYRLYVHTMDLIDGDTAFLTVIVAHLKAGIDAAEDRRLQVSVLTHRLDEIGLSDNYILCGDFNIYTSEEPAYQLLVNHSNPAVRFYDPVNRLGKWSENAVFSDIHTQSTHTGGSCFAGGGMDDRFDFILISEKILNGFDKIRALTDTYHAVGQDGNRFNQSINSPPNEALPTSMADALYNMSDHLPISMFLTVEGSVAARDCAAVFDFSVNNPVQNQLYIAISSAQPHAYSVQLISLFGGILCNELLSLSTWIRQSLDISALPQGVYCLMISDENGNRAVKKIIKNK
jgi:endonuclease/exonuclease/phosphatase family metal-dependent hydrolase